MESTEDYRRNPTISLWSIPTQKLTSPMPMAAKKSQSHHLALVNSNPTQKRFSLDRPR